MKHTLKTILLLLLTISTSHLYARLQGQGKIDSLLKELPRQKEDTNKVNVLNDLSYGYSSINPDEGIKYGQIGVDLATKLGWKTGAAKINSDLAANYLAKSDYPMAREYCHKALKHYEEIGDKKGIATNTGNMGTIYASEGNYPKALEYLLKVLKLHEETGSKKGIAGTACNIGMIYGHQSDYQKALEYSFRALKQYEELGLKQGIATTSGNIGLAYNNLGNYTMALEYYFKVLKLDEELGDKSGITSVTLNIGLAYRSQKNYTMAIDYYQKSIRIAEEIGDKYSIALGLGNFGGAFIDIIEDSSIKADKITVETEKRQHAYKPTGTIPKGKAALLRSSIEYLERGLQIGKEINSTDIMQVCYGQLARAYKLNGDYKKALAASDNLHAIQDSVFSKENNEKIVKMGMKDEYERQRYADSLKAEEKEKIGAIQLQKQKTFTYIGVAGILLLAGFSFFIVKERRKSEQERKKSDGLLLNILPTEVAEELKINGTTKAKHYDNVTVLFTDFVNFTQASERMNPQGLIDELHTCFKAFDEITAKYNIEKIKTIGDAYLAVAGLPTADPKHAEHIVHAAIEINTLMQDRLAKLGERTFEVRMGIHSGSVVAGIVGVKKFAYDIWGDTVNTAARMEQNSEAGKINISQTTYELVKDKISCVYRGEIEAKGKGGMKMYYVS